MHLRNASFRAYYSRLHIATLLRPTVSTSSDIQPHTSVRLAPLQDMLIVVWTWLPRLVFRDNFKGPKELLFPLRQ